MLQLIHRFKKSVVVMTLVFLLAVTFAGVGLGSGTFGGTQMANQAVASVDGSEISFTELSRARNNGSVPAQEAIDSLVDRTLIRNFGTRAGLAAGEGAIRQTLADIAPGGLTPEALRELLSSLRMTPTELEEEIRRDAVVRQVYSLINAAVRPDQAEIDRAMRSFLLARDVTVASASIEDFLSKVEAPSDAQIEQHYRESTSDYEVPAAIRYEFVVFNPDQYIDAVVVPDEDIELYYADNSKEFMNPASVEAAHIRMLYPKDAAPTAMAELRERAQRAHQRAMAGEPFSNLVAEYSDDFLTKAVGGSLGRLEKGKMSPEFDSTVFSMTTAGIAPLIDAPYGFQIVQVSAITPEKPKALDEVKDEIRAKLQRVEAPAYASARASELFSELRRSGSSLADFARTRGLELRSSAKLLAADEDVASELKGLTSQLIAGAFSGTGLPIAPEQIELDKESILAQVVERRESSVAPLTEVRERIVATLKRRAAEQMLRAKAQELKSVAISEFAKRAKMAGFSVKSGISLGASTNSAPAELNHGNLPEQVRELSEPGLAGPVFDGSKAFIAAVVATKEDSTVTAEQRQLFRRFAEQQVRMELGTLVEKSLIAEEKRNAKIEIKPEAYGS